MKILLVFVAMLVATQAGKWKEGLRVRFSSGMPDRNFFISLPRTVSEAKNSRWVQSPRPPGQPRSSLVLYNPSRDDVVIGVLYDPAGDVAGIQIASPQDTHENYIFDWEIQGYTEWKAPPNSAGVERVYWATALYFVSEETLAKSPEERAAARKGRILEEDHIYLTGFNRELLAVSTVASEISNTEETHFTKQACIPRMGQHYFYKMSPATPCTTDEFYPWFTFVDESPEANQLLGVGYMAFGNLDPSKLVRDYFERPSEMVTRAIINHAPDCFYNNIATIGGITMHIYFVDEPLLITC